MKKALIVTCFLTVFPMSSFLTYAESSYYQPPEESKEELVMDLFFSLLLPDIQEAVSHYYSDYLTTSPLVYPYQINILKMERTNGYRGFIFLVTVEITPVVGAHNPVGKDQLTFLITPGEVKLKKFQHIETYELPPNWQDIIKKRKNHMTSIFKFHAIRFSVFSNH